MKTIYIPLSSLICFGCMVSAGQAATPAPAVPASAAQAQVLDIVNLTAVPAGKYEVTLALEQLDGVPATLVLDCRDGRFTASSERFGQVEGRVLQTIGNGVFMIRLRGTGYTATQFWIFKPNGSAEIQEIPDRGEKQTAVPKK